MIVRALLLLTVVTVLGCGSEGPSGSASPEAIAAETLRINDWFDAQFEAQLAFSPIAQTMLGRKTDYDRFDDVSIAAQDAQLAWRRASVAEMEETFDRALLTPEAQTSWDVWAYELERAEAALPFRDNAYIFEQMSANHAHFPTILISFHQVDDASDMEAYVARIGAAAVGIRQLIEVSKANAAGGVRPPAFAYDFVIDESRNLITGAPFDDSGEDSAIWEDVNTELASLLGSGAIDEAGATALRSAARDALLGSFQQAYEELIAWQEEDRVNAPAVTRGVDALPNGTAYYNERLAANTTTTLTADQIHEIGLAEVARIRQEMITVKDQVGFTGELTAFFEEIRNSTDDPRHFYPDTDAGRQGYLDDATAAINRIEAELPNFFGILPKAGIEVRRVEAFREQPGAAQHYYQGTPDGSRPGIYYAHLSDMTAMPKSELEVIAYHEGIPGHHMQISIAQELTDIPTFRTQAGFNAYIEGWALYSEWLATEMPGTYVDPYSDFGRLGSEMWRAVRLVVDTGLHAKGWGQEQAVQYFLENAPVTEGAARSEIRRYMVLPGQATGYKIGMLKIQELRSRAETALGEDFDIRAFHDVVLGGGALPLTILEARVDRWIAELRGA